MFKCAFAIVAMLLTVDVASAQQPTSIPLQQRARQLAPPGAGATRQTVTPVSAQAPAPFVASPAQLAHQMALAASAAQRQQRKAVAQANEEFTEPELAPPRPSLTAPTLSPSPAAPGLIKAPGALAKKAPPRGKTIDPTAPGHRPIPPPPRFLPSAMQAGKAPKGGTAPPSDDPFGEPLTDPPAEGTPAEPPAEAPSEPPTEPVTEPPAETDPAAPTDTMPGEEPPPPTEPEIPTAPFEEEAPPTQPLPTPGRQTPTQPNGAAPRSAPPTTPGVPLPESESDEMHAGPDDSGGGGNAPSSGFGGAQFRGYYDRYCPPPFPEPGCEDCCLPGGTWATFDALAWWTQGMSLPAIVTTGSQNFGGVLSSPTTKVLFGNSEVDNEIRAGGRLNIGTWLNCERTIGFGGAFFALQRGVTNYDAGSGGDPLLARPFYDTVTNRQESQIVARENVVAGDVHARTTSDFLDADAYMRIALQRGKGRMIDFVQGYRYLQINDSINIRDHLISIDASGPVPFGTTISGLDQFTARNQFHGWQFGLLAEQQFGRFTFGGSGKIGLGNIHQVVNIYGQNVVEVPGEAPVTRAGSLLTQPSNIGRYGRNTFGFVPEINLNLGYQITYRLRVNFGYTFMWINRVAQSGRQINTDIDSNQLFGLPGTQPKFGFSEAGFWAQGMNLGIDYRF